MSHKKAQQILAGLVMVMVLAAVPVSAEAGSFERRGGASVWNVAMEWLAQRWSKIGSLLPLPREEGTTHDRRARSQDKKGSMLEPNG